MKNIAIIGPFNSRGGREMEAAFIADVLQENYKVTIYSTESINEDNDLWSLNPNLDIYIKRKSTVNRFKSKLSMNTSYSQLNFKKLIGSKTTSLEELIAKSDIIFIIAQLTSFYTREIIIEANKRNKKIIFRTTGTIPKMNLKHPNLKYLELVTLFINHSEVNSTLFKQDAMFAYKVIDQCVVQESFLTKEIKTISQVLRFYCVSRLDDNKDVITVIKAFNDLSGQDKLELHVIGDGEELKSLKDAKSNARITFHGHLEYDQMITTVSSMDCLIISSIEEAGPYSGLEAMLLNKLIISTKVGAMVERIPSQDAMWFDQRDVIALKNKILEYSRLNSNQINLIQEEHKRLYSQSYSQKSISKEYLDVVDLYL